MNKLNPIKYIENMISHHPKSISLWITEGIVINGERYIIKEFRLRDGSLYAVIAENKYTPKYFEVKLAPDEETLKDIYQAIEENKLAIEKEVTDRKNEIARVDIAIKANTTKIEQEIADRKSEIARVDKAIEANTAKIDKEIADRESEIERVDQAIEANTEKINQEITDRQNEITRVDNAINANTAKIDKEIQDRKNEITRVDGAIHANTEKINQEITDRTNEINRVDGKITALEDKSTTTDSQIAALDKATKDNKAKIDQEIIDRKREIDRVDEATKANKATIDQEIANRRDEINRVDQAVAANTAKINKEISDRESEIERVDQAIEANTEKINQEITDRQNEITRVDNAINANTAKIDKEIQDRKNEITRVDGAIHANTEKIDKEITDRKSEISRVDKAIAANTSKISQEITDRTNEINRIEGKLTGIQGSIKPIVSDNSGLLAVTNENSQIKLTPKHDGDKSQVLNSPNGTINVVNGTNGTNQKTTVEVNPEKVLTHDNLLTDYGISKTKSGNTTKLGLEYTRVQDGYDLNNLLNGCVRAGKFVNAPNANTWYFVSAYTENMYTIQEAVTLVDNKNTTYRRTKQNGVWGSWREQAGDKSVIDSAISANTTKINQEITDRKNEITRVEGKIPNEIGAVNLFKGSRDFSGSWLNGGSGVYAEDYQGVKIFKKQNVWGGLSQYFEVKTGEEYVFSAYVKSSAKADGVNFYLPHESKQPMAAGLVSFGSDNRQDNVNIGLTNNYKRIAIKIKITKGGWIAPRIERYNSDKYLYFGGYKLERGNVASDWSPAPEDTATQISNLSSEIKQTADGMTLLATKTELNTAKNELQSGITTATNKANAAQSTANNNAQTISTHTTQISALNTGLQAKVSQSDFNTLSGRVTTAENNIIAKANELSSKITTVEDKIPNEIGAVNLFKGSRDFSGSWLNGGSGVYAEDYQGVKIFKKQNVWGGLSQYFEVKTGEEYVFSAYVKSSAETDRVTFYLNHNSKQPMSGGLVSFGSTNNRDLVDLDLTDEYQRIAIKIKITKDGWIAPRLERSNTNAYLFFGGYKLERGNVASDWSPAPDDIQAKITSVENRLITNLDSLNSMPGTLNAVKLTPGSITGDMITGGRLRSTNGWTVIDLTSGIITFNGSSSYIQHSKNNKIFEIQSLLINGSADVRENMIASFGVRKSDNSSKSGIKFSLYNPVGGKPTAEATINADSFSLLDSKNTPLLSVNGSNTYLGNWNIYGWGDIPLAFVNGGLIAKDVGLEGHTESLKKIIEKLCTKTGITWL